LFWNIFDCLLMLGTALEFVDITTAGLRTVRLLRVARVLRMLRMFVKLRKMVYALIHSMQALFWLLIMLVVTLYIFALLFMQGATMHLEAMTAEEYQAKRAGEFSETRGTWIVIKRFGNVGLAMRSLFASLTGGDPWDWLLTPLMEEHWIFSVLALFFVLFFIFAVMNVVTGVFVDEAMKISQIDKDIMIEDLRSEQRLQKQDFLDLLASLDENGDGTITREELRAMLAEDEIQRWLAGCDIDLDLSNLDSVLEVLDHNKSGRIRPADLFSVLSKITGPARSVDLFLVYNQVKRESRELHTLVRTATNSETHV